jgi:hypothetical protein
MTDISPKQVESLTGAIKSGADLETSCHFAGISIQVCYRYLERGKLEAERIANGETASADEKDFLSFWEELRKARADAIVRNVAQIQKAAQDGQWQAAAWWLERTVPETYGKQRPNPSIGGDSPKGITEK